MSDEARHLMLHVLVIYHLAASVGMTHAAAAAGVAAVVALIHDWLEYRRHQ